MNFSTSHTPGSTSEGLISGARVGEQNSWRRLCEIYGPQVYRWSRLSGVSSEDAADIVQEVFQAVHRSLSTFQRERPSGSFRAWLWTVTRNKVRDHFRKQTLAYLANMDALVAGPQSPSTHSLASGMLQEGHQLIVDRVQSEFETKTWTAFWMTCVDERQTADVAEELDMSTGAVRKAKFRVLKRLREAFADRTQGRE